MEKHREYARLMRAANLEKGRGNLSRAALLARSAAEQIMSCFDRSYEKVSSAAELSIGCYVEKGQKCFEKKQYLDSFFEFDNARKVAKKFGAKPETLQMINNAITLAKNSSPFLRGRKKAQENPSGFV